MKLSMHFQEKRILAGTALAFILWSAVFIYQTSFVAIDGRRYFCLFDDAMISMRYAWNFSHGAGLVWNAGENVQGYTNLLMTLLMSVATWVFDKSQAALSIQILGVGFMLAIAWANLQIADHIATRAGRELSQRAILRVVAAILALVYYPLSYWTLTGMETGLLAVLLLFGTLFALRYEKSGEFMFLLLTALCLGLAFLTRNDSLIFAVLIWAYAAKTNRGSLVPLASAVLLYGLFILGQFLFQYLYYGELLPNTFTLKLTGWPLQERISNGLGFTLPFLLQTAFLLLPAILGTFKFFQPEKALLLSIVLAAIGYQIYVGGDPWNYWRMVAPTVPLLGILFMDAVTNAVEAQATKSVSPVRLLKSLSPAAQAHVIILLGMLVANSYFLPEVLFRERPFYVSANQHNVNIAIALREVTSPDASLGLLWAGAIPYYADRKSIDFLGKSDRYIAHLPVDLSGSLAVAGMKSPPGHNKYDLYYSIQQLQPTYIQDDEWGTQDLSEWAASRYVEVEYKGVSLLLLRDSSLVLWGKVNPR